MNFAKTKDLLFQKGKYSYIRVGIFLFLILGGLIAFNLYQTLYSPSVKREGVIHIATGSDFSAVVDTLRKRGIINDLASFKRIAEWKKYPLTLKAGAYRIKKGWSLNELLNHLRSGVQQPVRLTFNNVRTREELAGRLGHLFESDSVAFVNWFNNDSVAHAVGFSCESLPVIFIPNTYEFFWNTNPIHFVERMKSEYDHFWSDNRIKRAKEIGLTPVQIVILASIVQEESNKSDEKPRIAGVYLNRLKSGWPLQADPTVKFALGNFMLKRILNQYLLVDSPYNTYKYNGLPPGPINMPDIASVEAVLNAEQHKFMYFCAREDFSGYHNFARTLSEHNQNAQRYQQTLTNRKIWK